MWRLKNLKLNNFFMSGFPSYGLIPSATERSPTTLYNFADVTTGVPTIQRSEPSPLPTVSTSPLQRANDTQALFTAHSQAQALVNAQRSGKYLFCFHIVWEDLYWRQTGNDVCVGFVWYLSSVQTVSRTMCVCRFRVYLCVGKMIEE